MIRAHREPSPVWLAPLAAVPALAVHMLASRWSGAAPGLRALAADSLLFSLGGLALATCQRRPARALAAWALAMAAVVGVFHAHLALLGDWPRLADLARLHELASTLPLATGLAAGLTLALGAVWLSDLRRPGGRGWLLPLAAASLAGAVWWCPGGVVSGIDSWVPWLPWEGSGFARRGVALTAVRDAADWRRAARALGSLPPPEPSAPFEPTRPLRNLHIVLAESLTHPDDVGDAFPASALDPRLRAGQGGWALSPRFGGGSAQAEFELLCGVPATAGLPGDVAFHLLGDRPADCLPRQLAGRGYAVHASVPVSPWFFNARRAYASLGFVRVRLAPELPAAATRPEPTAAAALLSAERQRLAPALGSGPLLSYSFTVAPHFPWPLAEGQARLEAGSPARSRFATAQRETSAAIADHVEWLIERDPQALVLVLGDHQASGLGRSPIASLDAGRLAARLRVPLLLFDAGRPVTGLGTRPMFELSPLLRAALSGSPLPPAQREALRPLESGLLLVGPDSAWRCDTSPPRPGRCAAAEATREALADRTRRLIAATRR